MRSRRSDSRYACSPPPDIAVGSCRPVRLQPAAHWAAARSRGACDGVAIGPGHDANWTPVLIDDEGSRASSARKPDATGTRAEKRGAMAEDDRFLRNARIDRWRTWRQ